MAKLRKLLPRHKRAPLSRGEAMSRIRSYGTAPERVVRQILSRSGTKYRMNVRDLPGRPDFANKTRKFAIFVHGCFWHSHDCKHGSQMPEVRAEFWRAKRSSTKQRDARNVERLQSLGWQVLIIWECQTKCDDAKLISVIDEALGR